MNRRFSLVWSYTRNARDMASEHARRQGRFTARRLAIACLGVWLSGSALAADLPTGGQVVLGQGQIGPPSAQQLAIQQHSAKLAIDWQSFDIGEGKNVTFQQPSTDAIALNRVLGSDGSKIMGQLNANGRVFIVNPNGVLFGRNAQVNVGALVASTLNLSNEDFANGQYRFKGGERNAAVINQGRLSARDAGAVALLGGTVSNQGVIVAKAGTVALAAGKAMTLDFAGDGLLNVQVDEATKDALVENHQLIQAEGGQVLMTAKASNALLQTVVNNTGVIEARTLGTREGKIVLFGGFDGGSVQVAGTLDASAPTRGNGGFIDTSGAQVKIADGARVTTQAAHGRTGTWLIDPTDFNVSAGSATQTDSGIGATTLGNNLQNTSVTLQTVTTGTGAGHINVNSAVNWSANTTLTLNAHGNINVNAPITASGDTVGVVFNYGGFAQTGSAAAGFDYNLNAPVTLSGANAAFAANGRNFTLVRSMAQLVALGLSTPGASLAIAQNLDARGMTYIDAVIGRSGTTFTGTFDGLGHTVSNLTINTVGKDNIGLIGAATNATIQNIGVLGGSVTIGSTRSAAGGLVGEAQSNTLIKNAYSTANVVGGSNVGGLIGRALYNSSIMNSYASGRVTGTSIFGGLAGQLYRSSISNSYASGVVVRLSVSSRFSGGLVGLAEISSVNNSYALGAVVASGSNTPAVPGSGGLLGSSFVTKVFNSFYAITDASGAPINSGGAFNALGTPKTLNELKHLTTFASWGTAIDDQGGTGAVWRIYDGLTTPQLRSFLTPLRVTASDRVYDGSTLGSVYTTDLPGALLNGSLVYSTTSKNVGTYSHTAGTLSFLPGLYSGQQGYDISYSDRMSITPKATSGLFSTDDKVYDGTTAATLHGALSDVIAGDTVALVGSGSFGDKNVGTGKTVTVNSSSLSGADAGNYSVSSNATTVADITAKALSGQLSADDKVYDGTPVATLHGALSDVIAGDTVALVGSGSFGDKNVGTEKTVTVNNSSLSGADAGNYAFSSNASTQAAIAPRALHVTADDHSKRLDEQDPPLTWQISGPGLVVGDSLLSVFRGGLQRDPGETLGDYAIRQGSLLSDANYQLSFTVGVLQINPQLDLPVEPSSLFESASCGTIGDALCTTVLPERQAPILVLPDPAEEHLALYRIEAGGIRLPEGL